MTKDLFHNLASISFRKKAYSFNLNRNNLSKDLSRVVLVHFRTNVPEM